MALSYDIAVKVVSQEGTCTNEHKVGDKWVISKKTPEGMCMTAFQTLYPDLKVLRFGGTLPWSDDPDVCRVACPDAKNPVVFELRRLRK